MIINSVLCAIILKSLQPISGVKRESTFVSYKNIAQVNLLVAWEVKLRGDPDLKAPVAQVVAYMLKMCINLIVAGCI